MTKITFLNIVQSWQFNPFSDPNLGVLSVAAEARNHVETEVSFIDVLPDTEIPESDIFAFSGSTLELPGILSKAAELKKRFPESIMIAGGPHFDVTPGTEWEQKLSEIPLDIICRGEGESTIHRAIDYAPRSAGKPIVVTQAGQLLDLDTLSRPARDLLDRSRYFQSGITFGQKGMTPGVSSTIMASRGCPHICAFCASPELHKKKLRFRSLENVTAELEELAETYGVTELRWQDDNIPYNMKRQAGLSNVLNEMGTLSRGSARADTIYRNPDMLNILHHAGFRELGYGIESAEDHVLTGLSKQTTVEQNLYALRETKRRGIRTRAFIMSGLPGETPDSAEKMIDFLEEASPDIVTLTKFMPLPGCDIYRHPDKFGVEILDRNPAKYNIAIGGGSNEEIFTHRLSTVTPKQMSTNMRRIKQYIFDKGISNVAAYNTSSKK